MSSCVGNWMHWASVDLFEKMLSWGIKSAKISSCEDLADDKEHTMPCVCVVHTTSSVSLIVSFSPQPSAVVLCGHSQLVVEARACPDSTKFSGVCFLCSSAFLLLLPCICEVEFAMQMSPCTSSKFAVLVLYMFTCVCPVHVYVYNHLWLSEVSIGCFPQLHHILLIDYMYLLV